MASLMGCSADAGVSEENVGGVEQAVTFPSNDHLTIAFQFGNELDSVYHSVNCIWQRPVTAGGPSDQTQWSQLFCPDSTPRGLGVVLLPESRRRCIFWVRSVASEPGGVRYRCEATPGDGDWGAVERLSPLIDGQTGGVTVKRIAAVREEPPLEQGARSPAGIFALGSDNHVYARWYKNGAWTSRWCDAGRPTTQPLHDISVDIGAAALVRVAGDHTTFAAGIMFQTCQSNSAPNGPPEWTAVETYEPFVDRVQAIRRDNASDEEAVLLDGVVTLQDFALPEQPEPFRSFAVILGNEYPFTSRSPAFTCSWMDCGIVVASTFDGVEYFSRYSMSAGLASAWAPY